MKSEMISPGSASMVHVHSAVLLVVLEAVHATGTPESSMHTLLTE